MDQEDRDRLIALAAAGRRQLAARMLGAAAETFDAILDLAESQLCEDDVLELTRGENHALNG